MGRARGTRKDRGSGEPAPGRGAWPPELRDLQRRGGMAPDWHDTWHAAGEGVEPVTGGLFSPIFPQADMETHLRLRESIVSFGAIRQMIAGASEAQLDSLDTDDPFVASLWQQERLRVQALLDQIGVSIDLDALEDKWKERFVSEVKGSFVAYGARLVEYSLLAQLLPGAARHRDFGWASPEQKERIARALEKISRDNPTEFKKIAQEELLPAFHFLVEYGPGPDPVFDENCMRTIASSAFPSAPRDPWGFFMDYPGLDWSKEERMVFLKVYLSSIGDSLAIEEDVYPDGNLDEEKSADRIAFRRGFERAFELYVRRLVDRPDFEEQMKKLCGDQWDDIRKEILQFAEPEHLPQIISEHLYQVSFTTDQSAQKFLKGEITTEEFIAGLLQTD